MMNSATPEDQRPAEPDLTGNERSAGPVIESPSDGPALGAPADTAMTGAVGEAPEDGQAPSPPAVAHGPGLQSQ